MNENTYLFKFLLALDRFASVLLFRDADITISSETGFRLIEPNPPLWALALAAILPKGHCPAAIQTDIAAAKAALVRLSAK